MKKDDVTEPVPDDTLAKKVAKLEAKVKFIEAILARIIDPSGKLRQEF